jgi:hypothetical protein
MCAVHSPVDFNKVIIYVRQNVLHIKVVEVQTS